MLFPFLHELNRDVFDQLPWDMQRKIADFHPNVPALPRMVWNVVHTHMNTRYCGHCGRNLPKWNQTFHCLCRRRFHCQKYHPQTRPFRTYRRPFHIFDKPDVHEWSYENIFNASHESGDVLVASNQQDYVFNLTTLLRKKLERLRALTARCHHDTKKVVEHCIKKRLNTHTCLRSYLDAFAPSLYYPLKDDAWYPGVVFIDALGVRDTQNMRVVPLYGQYKAPSPRLTFFPSLDAL